MCPVRDVMHIADKVVRVITAEHISPEELAHMVTHAAMFSGVTGFNRVFYQWLFKLEGERLLDMRATDMVVIGQGNIPVYEDHDACGGQGCKECGWVGSLCRLVTDISLDKLS